MSRDAVERIVRKHAATAASNSSAFRLNVSRPMFCATLGVDRTIIAIWLGHESVETTQVYIHADIELKGKAMALTDPVNGTGGRYRPGDELLTFLECALNYANMSSRSSNRATGYEGRRGIIPT